MVFFPVQTEDSYLVNRLENNITMNNLENK